MNTVAKNEQQTVSERYRELPEADKMIFKSVLEIAVVLLKNMQQVQTTGRTSDKPHIA